MSNLQSAMAKELANVGSVVASLLLATVER